MAEKKNKQYVSDNAQLMAEWNWERNMDLSPSKISDGSHKKVWWKCHEGHEWQAEIKSRKNGIGCPYCSGRCVLKGETDLQSVNPILANEWNYEKNGELTPADVMPNSRKKVWWTCNKGHEWQAMIYSRNSGNGCPFCSSESNTSFPEYVLIYYLKEYGIDAIHHYRGNGYELDVYIPLPKVAIEYDGYYWHKNKRTKDLEKNARCVKDGIKLYRIREGLASLDDSSIDYVISKNQKEISTVFEDILYDIIGKPVVVDLEKDSIAIENLREYTEKEHSISAVYPHIAKEWNYGRNGSLKPEYFYTNSHKKVWWRCVEGHEWQALIDNRTNGDGCPYCAGRVAVKGETDLQTLNPTLAREWNKNRNGNLSPEMVKINSGKRVWWLCGNGHEWQARIADRNKGRGCPYCSGKKALKGYNDLTTNAKLCVEWNYEKNNKITPTMVTAGSTKIVWWKCSEGHEWQAMINNRSKGNECPYCSGRKVLKGYNDLLTVNSALAEEWNYEKNDGLKPDYFTKNSNKKVWWKCNKGHEWESRIGHRSNGSRCPICARNANKSKSEPPK